MLFKCVLFCCFLVNCYAATVGDRCVKNGQIGTCAVLIKCLSAVEDVRWRRNLTYCGVDASGPIVCCIDYEVPPPPSVYRPSIASTLRPNRPLPSIYVPPEEDYIEVNEIPTGCAPVPSYLNSPRTGQQAFDKCLEYQEQLVYSCDKGVTLTTDMHRVNHCHHDADELLITPGTVAKNELPHLAMLGYQNEDGSELVWICAGTIVSEKFVLTAGQCYRAINNSTTFVVQALSQESSDVENRYKVKNFIVHPNYKPPSKYHDLALLELEAPIQLSQFVVPACLDVGGPVNDSYVLAVRGNNQKIILQKLPPQTCIDEYRPTRSLSNGFDSLTQTCFAPSTSDQDLCQGDSGSALLIKSKSVRCMYSVIGVTSTGLLSCGAANRPGFFTRISTYVPWIENIVWP